MASVEPTVEQASKIKTFGEVLVWAGFDNSALFSDKSDLASLLKHLDQRPNSNLRVIASIAPAELTAELDEWKTANGQRPKMGISAQANLAFDAARIIAGTKRRAAEEEAI